jgi:hypothetical protein
VDVEGIDNYCRSFSFKLGEFCLDVWIVRGSSAFLVAPRNQWDVATRRDQQAIINVLLVRPIVVHCRYYAALHFPRRRPD